ncbi:MAG: cytochrome c [Myxococcota bacterium]
MITSGGWITLAFLAATTGQNPPAYSAPAPNHVRWMLHCQGCHGAHGSGMGSDVPALADQVARFLSVPGGRSYLIRVPGVTGAPLDDEALASLVNWMLSTFDPTHLPEGFRPYAAREIREAREKPLGPEALGRRSQLMAAIERKPQRSSR